MAYTVLGYLPTILSLSLFIAIVGTLSRMYRDSEMVIWFSSGRGLVGLRRPLFRFAWPVLLVIAVMALVVWPWANSADQGMRRSTSSAATSSASRPASSRNRQRQPRVLHRQGHAGQRPAPTSSSAAIERDLQIITSARSGRIENIGDASSCCSTTASGWSAAGRVGLKISEFKTYGTRAGGTPTPREHRHHAAARALSTRDAAARPSREPRRAGLALGHALAAINFVLLA
jgi:lipopolysaccharide export system permease protein